MFFKIIYQKELYCKNNPDYFLTRDLAELKKIFRADFSLFEEMPIDFKLNKNILAAAVEVNSSFLYVPSKDNLYGKAIMAAADDTELMKMLLKWDILRFNKVFLDNYSANSHFITECLTDNWCLEPFLAEVGLLAKEHHDLLAEYAECRFQLAENKILNWQRFADLKTARQILENLKTVTTKNFVKSGPVVQLLFSRDDWLSVDIVKRQISSLLDQGCNVFYHEITSSLSELVEAQRLVGTFLPIDLRVLGGSGRKNAIVFNTGKFNYLATELSDYSQEMSADSVLVLASCYTGLLMKEKIQRCYPASCIKAPFSEIYDIEYYFGKDPLPKVAFKGI